MFNVLGNLITAPFAALLRWLYEFTGSYGLAIIFFGLVIKLVTLPFQMKSKRSMVRMGRLSGKQAELQKKYANNQQKYSEELAKLYQEEGINPMGGCLWSFLPMFLILPLYQIVYRPVTAFMGLGAEALEQLNTMAAGFGYDASAYNAAYAEIGLSDFIHSHWDQFEGSVKGLIDVDFHFLGINLSATPSSKLASFSFSWACVGVILIPVVSALLQFLSNKIIMKSNGQEQAQQGQMKMLNLMMPLFSLWICFTMPSAMGLFWIFNSIFYAVQEVLLGKFYTKKLNAEEEERAAKREAARQLRQEEGRKRAAEQREQESKKPKKVAAPKKPAEKKISTNEAGRVGERPYARGRSYQEHRYDAEEGHHKE